MNIPGPVREAHERLSKASVRFLEFVQANPGALLRSSFDLLDGKEEVGRLQSWPIFIDPYTKGEMEKAAVKVFNLLKQVPRRIFDNDPHKISNYFEIPEEIVKIQLDGATEDHIENLLGRGDFIFSPWGLKCLEFNISAKMGGMQVAYWEPLYAQIPIISKFLRENQIKICNSNLFSLLVGHLMDNALRKISPPFHPGHMERPEHPGHEEHLEHKEHPEHKETEINIAVVFSKYGEGFSRPLEEKLLNQIYKNLLNLKFKTGGYEGEVIFCDYHHLNTRDNGLFFKKKRIRALMEMYHGVVPEEIWKLFKAGNISICNGPITKLLSNKLNLAVLSQHADSPIWGWEEREIIKQHIPWSRKFIPGEVIHGVEKVKLEEWVFSHREQSVLKPSMGLQGDGIYIGKNTTGEQWEKVVKKAFKERTWLIQDYVPSLPFIFQRGEKGWAEYIMAMGLYVFGSRYGGAWARLLPIENKNGVINSSQGAEEGVVLEIEE